MKKIEKIINSIKDKKEVNMKNYMLTILLITIVIFICTILGINFISSEEDDIEALKVWLVEHGYYVGDSSVAKSLRDIADSWDD